MWCRSIRSPFGAWCNYLDRSGAWLSPGTEIDASSVRRCCRIPQSRPCSSLVSTKMLHDVEQREPWSSRQIRLEKLHIGNKKFNNENNFLRAWNSALSRSRETSRMSLVDEVASTSWADLLQSWRKSYVFRQELTLEMSYCLKVNSRWLTRLVTVGWLLINR